MAKIQIINHDFTPNIIDILKEKFSDYAEEILTASPLLMYLNRKTVSAHTGSKSRGAFANIYALFVLIEDYINQGYAKIDPDKKYSDYEGAAFISLLRRQRELPFGKKLQNHALNSRLNGEFSNYFKDIEAQPIIHDKETKRYWIHEDFLIITVRHKDGKEYQHNIAESVIKIINKYIKVKQEALYDFIDTCKQISEEGRDKQEKIYAFIASKLQKNVDARLFEIVSYAVLKAKYSTSSIWIGDTKDSVVEKCLELYKTGRTNANDGGIDFVMTPIGRFFQVTETIDVTKYFLDIDKVQRFPITFVIKSAHSPDEIRDKIKKQAIAKYKIISIVEKYSKCIEEIINIPILLEYFSEMVAAGFLSQIMDEIIVQSEVEFQHIDEDSIVDSEE